MGPIGHTVLSTSIGIGVWKATGNPLAVPIAITTGVFIDGDHVLDYLEWFVKGYREHMLVLLHAWEYVIVILAILVFWRNPIYMAAALGYAGHVISDHLANPTFPLTYFITYRIYRRFKLKWLVRNEPRLAPPEEIPLWGRIEPWLWKRVYRIRHRGQLSVGEERPESLEQSVPEGPNIPSD